MTDAAQDPRCPECGEPIGQTATYCMHCSADLTSEREAADADHDGAWDAVEDTSPASADSGSQSRGTGRAIAELLGVGTSSSAEGEAQLLDPDGLVDDTLTVAVGIVGGLLVGVLATLVLAFLTGSGYALLFGVVGWLGATAYLVRRRTVQGAVAKSGYAVAAALLLVPVIALSPVVEVDGGVEERGGLLIVLLVFVAIPSAIAAAIGWIASRYVPEDASDGGA